MKDYRIGSVAGFEIRVDLSWVVLFVLLVWTFATSAFPASVPGLGLATYLVMAFATTALFFASLLAHELSHAFAARAKGIHVGGITLFILGGVAHLRGEARTPGHEFLIAIVGPLASFALGLVFGLGWYAGARAGVTPALTAILAHLAVMNVLLAVFNLLPGFPLDGGRVFRAAAWHFTGDLGRATRMAATGGRWLGFILMGLGIAQVFLRGDLVQGLWLVFIGWFVSAAAVASLRQHQLATALEGATAREVMTPNPESVHPDLALSELISDHFLRSRYEGFPVVEDGRPVGLVTLRQVKADS
jgi:Zn-dependent protease